MESSAGTMIGRQWLCAPLLSHLSIAVPSLLFQACLHLFSLYKVGARPDCKTKLDVLAERIISFGPLRQWMPCWSMKDAP